MMLVAREKCGRTVGCLGLGENSYLHVNFIPAGFPDANLENQNNLICEFASLFIKLEWVNR